MMMVMMMVMVNKPIQSSAYLCQYDDGDDDGDGGFDYEQAHLKKRISLPI